MSVSYFAYRVSKELESGIFIVHDSEEVDEFSSSLDFFLSLVGKGVASSPFYPYEIAPESSIPPSERVRRLRLRSLFDLVSLSGVFFVADLLSLIQPVVSRSAIRERTFIVKKGVPVGLGSMVEWLNDVGYKRVDYVGGVSEFAVRGSIVDVFSPFYDKPLRIDFFGDEVEDIRLFFLSNQGTLRKLEEAKIILPFEYSFRGDEFGYSLMKERSYLVDFSEFERMDVYSLVGERDVDVAYRRVMLFRERFSDVFLSSERIRDFLSSAHRFEDFEHVSLFPEEFSVDEKIEKMKSFGREGRVIIACASPLRMDRVEKFLKERGISFSVLRGSFPKERGIYLTDRYLRRGFADGSSGIAFVSFEDLFGRVVQRYVTPLAYRKRIFEPGSKVIHKKYGVGIYRGVKKLEVDGRVEELVEIDYRGSEKLYVPPGGLDQVFEYNGPAEVDSLRSSNFKKREESVRRSIKKILTELLHAYAKRRLVNREPYEVDTLFYSEFQASFEHEETPDQIRAIRDVERDMSSDRPMDRLVCGDASFGKTEVAMRAAAIAVFNGKQVVVMAPTTVLSLQHYRTFKDRFENFPVNIELLNRFVSGTRREQVLRDVKAGRVDILITTHSVYSDKVKFANLGLVVVDEEQRFGVRVKEKLKARYPHVDVLYMSATPIPRTMSMSLSGILDVSVIKTAPVVRKPIETFVMRRKERVVRDAILREVARGGEVFFIHNRIEDLESIKEELLRVLPGIKSEVVHAKMPKTTIKRVFGDFEKGKFHVLITTSIVESGLDFKNANTIIIDDAENFGLSDLYQLRGRVGRSDKVAYAYLLFRGDLSDKARQRLSYIREFIERGAGFNIAMRDLEIRGSGNILGKDQSGNVRGLGIDTYMSLMEEAIAEIKKEPRLREVEIHSRVECYIPDGYMPAEEKFAVYKALSSAKEIDEIEAFKESLIDRYGAMPRECSNLIELMAVKLLSQKLYVKKLLVSESEALLEFYVDANLDTGKLVKEVVRNGGRFMGEYVLHLEFGTEALSRLRKFLQMVV